MRFGIETPKGSGVNVHLLFSPDDADHVDQIKRFLERLEFSYMNESYRCSRADLIQLGKKHNPKVQSDLEALATGVNQFKVSFDQLQDVWRKSDWVRRNCLVAVAAGEQDGTSGLRDANDSFAALRKSIESFSHIIFSANPSQIAFWLGHKCATIEDLESKWGGMKPCLHGSDAHKQDRVGNPDGQRFCWIKGDLSFESLRQACIEPEGRVHIGSQPPRGSLAGHTIKTLEVAHASWMTPSRIQLNPGLIAIIGARGSGKTALADLMAAGGLAAKAKLNTKSFIVRAREHLGGSRSTLTWENGDLTESHFKSVDPEEVTETPKVQYLSQQFVEDLCSAEGLADSLVEEIQRVIFTSHPVEKREGASSFSELFAMRSAAAIARRDRYEREIENISIALTDERQLKQDLPALERQRVDLDKQIELDKKDRNGLIGKGQEERAKRHEQLAQALDKRRRTFDAVQARLRALNALREDVADYRERRIPQWLTELRTARSDAALEDNEWDQFRLGFSGDVDRTLDAHIMRANIESQMISGASPSRSNPLDNADPNAPLVPADADLAATPLALLQQEIARLGTLIGIDEQNTKRFTTLNDKIAKAGQAYAKLSARIEKAKTADVRIQELFRRRRDAYAGVFRAIAELETELSLLYAPLETHLKDTSGSLNQLGFAVRRQVDIEAWATEGEKLLDLRKTGPFKGRGSLLEAAKERLLSQWQEGTPENVSEAMQQFIKANETAIRLHKPDGEDSREWTLAVSKWLHKTSHIVVSYGLQYDRTDIERLSPGTRGIVLLLLYLAIDEEDDRPLIIDQPEENLDPKSIYNELVQRFRIARRRRQIIIVTHNANLVVNTDADQVIVATAGQHRPGELPEITYESGGLENPVIRKHVCDILEGGERAFKARARRLRVGLNDASVQQVAVRSR